MELPSVTDTLGRPLRSLRVSVTDRCNLRCQYCMPEQDYVWLPRKDILTFEEAGFLVDVFAGLGVDRIRITGGEPLLRNDLAVDEQTSAPADRYALADGTTFGIISSTTAPFCRSCDRSRLTADGLWYLCLYAQKGTDLRGALRNGASASDLHELITSTWTARSDRGAETRLAAGDRQPLVPVEELQKRPHLEMHTRGG